MLDMARAREVFEASDDFTVGLEEELQILDPDTLELDQRYGELAAAAQGDPLLAKAIAGELIESEIEIRSGRGATFADAVAAQRVADAIVDAGVKIIFNYSEALLAVPPEVTVHTSSPAVDLLYALYFYLT